MNIGTFAGRIGRDAETKTIPSGKTVTEFSLAVDIGFGDKKATEWVRCTLWGERGQKVAQYLTKGKSVTVVGRIKSRAYSAKDGTPKAEIECDVLEFTLQGGRETAQETAPVSPKAAQVDADFDDAIPFAAAWAIPAGLLASLAYAAQWVA